MKTILAMTPVNKLDLVLPCTTAQLLEEIPLHTRREIQRLFSVVGNNEIKFPPSINLHCDGESCDGMRRHSLFGSSFSSLFTLWSFHQLIYLCENCRQEMKIFYVKAERLNEQAVNGICSKIYQDPPFGDPIPKRLFKFIGEENREHFLQARRSIARGLGIGAYAYYRRIVENTKFDLVKSILEVALATHAPAPQVELLKKAQEERQFSKAIEILRDVSAIPATLLIDGHNPLALLHDTLSEGIHELSDEECLKRARC
jgi:hypothetical protein